MSALADLLPPQATCAEARRDGDGEGAEWAAEREAIARAVEVRRLEFTTARDCARRALTALGAPASAIPRRPSGEPVWPDGVVGSITHCPGYRASAVAWRDAVAAVGIDAEPNERLPARILGRIAVGAELARDRELGSTAGVSWDRLLFSAKECVYKAWFPLTGERLTFGDADISLGEDGRFAARLTATPTGPRRGELMLQGRWALSEGILITALAF